MNPRHNQLQCSAPLLMGKVRQLLQTCLHRADICFALKLNALVNGEDEEFFLLYPVYTRNRRIGSITDYDPINDQFGSIVGQYTGNGMPCWHVIAVVTRERERKIVCCDYTVAIS